MCEVIQHIEPNGFDVFLARATATYVDEACIEDGWPVPRQVNPPLRGTDGKFWTVGEEQIPTRHRQNRGLPFKADHRAYIAKEMDGSDSAYRAQCHELSMKNQLGSDKMTRAVYDIPDDVAQALTGGGLWDRYLARPPYQQNDYIGWITRGKRQETRGKRLKQMLDELRAGDAYMGMAYRAAENKGARR